MYRYIYDGGDSGGGGDVSGNWQRWWWRDVLNSSQGVRHNNQWWLCLPIIPSYYVLFLWCGEGPFFPPKTFRFFFLRGTILAYVDGLHALTRPAAAFNPQTIIYSLSFSHPSPATGKIEEMYVYIRLRGTIVRKCPKRNTEILVTVSRPHSRRWWEWRLRRRRIGGVGGGSKWRQGAYWTWAQTRKCWGTLVGRGSYTRAQCSRVPLTSSYQQQQERYYTRPFFF